MSKNSTLKSQGLQKLRRAFKALKHTMPIENSKFSANLWQVEMEHISPSTHTLSEHGAFATGGLAGIIGMTASEMENAKINSFDGKLIRANGELLNITKGVYNITKDGNLVVASQEDSDSNTTSVFSHASITKDGSVIGAGHLDVKNGIITMINNNSGHYKPTALALYNTLEVMSGKFGSEIFSEDCEIFLRGHQAMRRDYFMFHMREPLDTTGLNRVDKERIERKSTHEAINKPIVLINQWVKGSVTIEDAIINSQLILPKNSSRIAFQFPKEMFTRDEQLQYGITMGIKPQDLRLVTKDISSVIYSLIIKGNSTCAIAIDKLMALGIFDHKFNVKLIAFILKPQDFDFLQINWASMPKIKEKIIEHLLSPSNISESIIQIGNDTAELYKTCTPETQALIRSNLIVDSLEQHSLDGLAYIACEGSNMGDLREQIIKSILDSGKISMVQPKDIAILQRLSPGIIIFPEEANDNFKDAFQEELLNASLDGAAMTLVTDIRPLGAASCADSDSE